MADPVSAAALRLAQIRACVGDRTTLQDDVVFLLAVLARANQTIREQDDALSDCVDIIEPIRDEMRRQRVGADAVKACDEVLAYVRAVRVPVENDTLASKSVSAGDVSSKKGPRMTELTPCLCPNCDIQMREEYGPLAPGGPEGRSWTCPQCGIQRMWPDEAPTTEGDPPFKSPDDVEAHPSHAFDYAAHMGLCPKHPWHGQMEGRCWQCDREQNSEATGAEE